MKYILVTVYVISKAVQLSAFTGLNTRQLSIQSEFSAPDKGRADQYADRLKEHTQRTSVCAQYRFSVNLSGLQRYGFYISNGSLLVTGFEKTLRMRSTRSSCNAHFQQLRSKFVKIQILSYPCQTTLLLTVPVVYGG